MNLAFLNLIIYSLPAISCVAAALASPLPGKRWAITAAGITTLIIQFLHATPLRGKISCKAEYLWGSLATLAATCLFLLSRHFLPGSVATFIALLAASLLPLAGKPLRDADIRAISMGNCCIGLTLLSWGICSLIVPDFTLYADWLITIGAMLYAVLTINQSRISWNM